MQCLFGGEVLDLMPTRKARRNHDGVGGRGSHGGQQLPLADCSREIVMFALIAERACHATTAGIHIDGLAIGNSLDESLDWP